VQVTAHCGITAAPQSGSGSPSGPARSGLSWIGTLSRLTSLAWIGETVGTVSVVDRLELGLKQAW